MSWMNENTWAPVEVAFFGKIIKSIITETIKTGNTEYKTNYKVKVALCKLFSYEKNIFFNPKINKKSHNYIFHFPK